MRSAKDCQGSQGSATDQVDAYTFMSICTALACFHLVALKCKLTLFAGVREECTAHLAHSRCLDIAYTHTNSMSGGRQKPAPTKRNTYGTHDSDDRVRMQSPRHTPHRLPHLTFRGYSALPKEFADAFQSSKTEFRRNPAR